jgi:hypothetical protein
MNRIFTRATLRLNGRRDVTDKSGISQPAASKQLKGWHA